MTAAASMFENPFVKAIITVAKWFPVVFITAVVLWSYYAYVVQLCILEIQSITEKVFYLIFYHMFFVLFAWSYCQCIFTDPAHVPSRFRLSSSEISQLESIQITKDFDAVRSLLEKFAKEKDLPVYTRGYNGDIRYCEKCCIIKPDRSHHCSLCDRCVMKMDHHCPWINNCVCFNNYKFFILFLGYSVLYCLYISLTDMQYFIKFWKDELHGDGGKFHILFLFFVSAMFMISLLTLFGYHCFLTVTNRSTIESYRAPVFLGGTDKNGFHLGRYQNFIQVFGDQKLYWFLPVFTSKGEGCEYPVRSPRSIASDSHQTTNQDRLQDVNVHPEVPSAGRGHSFPVRTNDEDTDDLLQQQKWTSYETTGEENPSIMYSNGHASHVILVNEHHT